MPIDYKFESVDRRNIDDLMKFVDPQNLGYPNWAPWTEKTRSEILTGIKQAYLLRYYGTPAGDAIFQPHKQIPGLTEIKNVRTHPKLRNKKCATLMVGNIEFEMPWEAIICDARISQTDSIQFMISQGYLPIANTFLYDSHNQDTVLIKLNNQKDKNKIIYNVRSKLNLEETPRNLIYPLQK